MTEVLYCNVEIWKISKAKKNGIDRLIETFKRVSLAQGEQIKKLYDKTKFDARIIKMIQKETNETKLGSKEVVAV